ncbi:response regulator [Nitrosopumilus maritimus]|uniref:Response regulator receiver protein n=1 Tax=Nitrosopumilus maritimus (strain SCM1) TaxID=436308 RepID=A9A3K9_NITMS|nr:response regulator [Nitrosopumilus maritimus]ABX12941.1 response regulator receiver protein [Nitrosopumilus maritimus SCM1]
MKILHIDDNATFTEVLSKLLELHDHTCDVSNDGKEALQMALTNKYDAIILDLDMPEFTGNDFIDELVKVGVISSQNIIVLTGLLPSEQEVQDMISKGVKICVEKPISIEKLNDILVSLTIKPSTS